MENLTLSLHPPPLLLFAAFKRSNSQSLNRIPYASPSDADGSLSLTISVCAKVKINYFFYLLIFLNAF